MTIHPSILAWEIPWTEEPSGLQSMGLQRVEHDLVIEHACIRMCTWITALKKVIMKIRSGEKVWVIFGMRGKVWVIW